MIYRFFPKSYREHIRGRLELAGMKTKSESYINKSVFISLMLATVITVVVRVHAILIFMGVFAGVFIFLNAYLTLTIDKRRNFVENVLPDALELMAANIRAGFIPSKAILLSARNEFGPLAEAIRKSGKEIMTGKSLTEGLNEIPKYIKSEVLERSIKLISEGSAKGGQLVSLLEENAVDIRRKQAIKKEVKANIIMYGIFIVFAGVFGAPVLYALSLYLITTLTSMSSASIAATEVMSRGVPFFSGGVEISTDFLFGFSVVSIMITTFFSGLIIGLIDTGREMGGIKYVPIFMIIALVVFFGANYLISSMFSTFMPG
ncbi:MAG: type II secretion system F family protein [Candidatus Aenigmarchaeota archaeon]|nr:type II secretion system F family protein [Candidatus Aenigmarchaeota archaeon]MCK4531473.1 type II secretion system F family protein [Candidatus Aenigmarchaeota archaeon]